MAELEEAVQDRLTAYVPLYLLVAERVYPQVLPKTPTLPALVYQRISTVRVGAMGVDPGVATVRIQVDSYAATYATARATARQVRLALERWRDDSAVVPVLATFVENEADSFEEDTRLHRVTQDYLMTHREDVL